MKKCTSIQDDEDWIEWKLNPATAEPAGSWGWRRVKNLFFIGSMNTIRFFIDRIPVDQIRGLSIRLSSV